MRSELPSANDIAVFDALGSPIRRQIVERLSQKPHAVGELAKLFPVSRPAVSKHLRLLEEVGLVVHETDGNRNLYRLDAQGFEDARQWLDNFWTISLNRFRLVAENTHADKNDE